MGRTRSGTSEARQRILETADRLFYQDGIRAVGIDRIIAEAGTQERAEALVDEAAVFARRITFGHEGS